MTKTYFKRGEETCWHNVDERDRVMATIEFNDCWVSNPAKVRFCEELGWEEYTPTPAEPTREEKIQADIRAVYSESDEFMINRHYSADPIAYADEFNEYNSFVESVIAKYPEEN